MSISLEGKICVVTGANSGIGKATAAGLARLGASVVMLCRNEERGRQAQIEIRRQTGNEAVELAIADLASQAEVRRLADDLVHRYPRLHVLVNNAGLQLWRRSVTTDGLETAFAVNYLAPFLLTNLVLEALKAVAPARVVNVCSMVHRWGEIDFEDLQAERRYDSNRAYYQSKLAMLLFTYELARRLEGTGITVNAMEPGMVRTRFARDYRGFYRLMATLWRPFMKSPGKGADTVIYLASSPEVEAVTGKYFKNRRAIRSSERSYDIDLARRLWQVSSELTGLPADR